MSQNTKKTAKSFLLILLAFVGLVGLYYLVSWGFLALVIVRENKTRYPEIIYDHPSADRSFVTEEPCRPPCWYGLIPGISTLEETKEVVYSLDFVGPINFQNFEDSNVIHLSCAYIVGRHGTDCATLRVSNGILQRITHEVVYSLTFKEAITKLGEPDQYVEYLYGESCFIDLEWLDQGIRITHREYMSSDMLCIKPSPKNPNPPLNASVSSIEYVTSDSIVIRDESSGDCCVWNQSNP